MITIPRLILNTMLAECQRDIDHETCGILAGKTNTVEKIYPMRNISETRATFYQLDPVEQLSVFKDMRATGLDLVAIYHSHINARCFPSAKDVELAFYPESAYIIVAVNQGVIDGYKAFRIVDGIITEEEIV